MQRNDGDDGLDVDKDGVAANDDAYEVMNMAMSLEGSCQLGKERLYLTLQSRSSQRHNL